MNNDRRLTLVFASILFTSFSMFMSNAFADTAIATISVNDVRGIAVNPSTNMVYIANGNADHIQVIDGTTDTITANVTTANVPSGNWGCYTDFVAANPVTNIIYANNGACVYSVPSGVPEWIPGTLSVINGTTNAVITTVGIDSAQADSQPSFPLAINPVTNKIYVISTYNSVIDVVNGTTNQLSASIKLPSSSLAYDVAVNPQTNTIYVLSGNLVYVINGTTDSIVQSFSWGKSSTHGIGVNPTTNKIYISNSDDSISVIDGTTDQTITNVGSSSYGFVAVNPTTDKIYVSNSSGGSNVAVLDGSTDTLAGQVQVGQSPYGIGININTNKIYVGNSGSSSVSVIDGSVSSTDFTVSSSPSTLTIPAGSQANSTITALSINGFSGTVSLSTSAPSALTASLNPSFVTVTANGNASSLLNISVPSSNSGGQYTVTVTGTNGSLSRSTLVTVSVLSIPSPPQNLQANAISSSQICMNWYPPANNGGSQVTGYNIQGSTDNGTSWYNVISDMNSPNAANPSWCDSNQTPNTTYTYRVFAINNIGTSQPSNTASATTFAGVSKPPTGLTATAVSSSQINLGWNVPSNNGGSAITGYMIERSTDSGTTWSTIVANSASTGTTYSDTGLTASTAYTYRVSAINSVGTSSPSNTASATTQAPAATVPQPPTGLTATVVSPKEINLSWNASTNNGGMPITAYQIMISYNNSTFTTLTKTSNTNYSSLGLHPNTTYYFKVFAINSVGTSTPSNTASAKTL